MARSTLTYPLLSPILKNMSFTELQVAFWKDLFKVALF
jgi:hypothetical protein